MIFFKVKEIKSFVMLCLPLAAAFLGQKGMQFIDTFMMGWIGPEALAAGALGTGIFMTILVFCFGLLSAVGVTIVHVRGAAQSDNIHHLLYQALYLALLLSLPCMLLAWLAPYYLTAMGQNPAVAANTLLLLHGLTWGIPGFLLFYILRDFISAFALARAVMIVSFLSIPLTFAGNYVLIYGKYGFPALGIAGIGYTGAVVGWFMFGCLLLYCRKQRILKQHLIFSFPKPDFNKLKALVSVGAPTGVIMILDTATFLIAALMAGYFGVIALAAFQIALQCASIAYNLPLAVSVVTALQVGHAFGAKDFYQIKRTICLGLCIGLMMSMGIALILILAPHFVVQLFSPVHNQFTEIYPTAKLFLLVVSILTCFDGGQAIIIGALRGMKDTFRPMLISVFCYLGIGAGASYFLAFHTQLHAMGVWWGLSLGIFSLCLIAGLRLKREFCLRYYRLDLPRK